MPILNGPLFSLAGKKTLAKTVVYYRRKGQDCARQRVVPSNPKTADQQEVRQIFKDVSQGWRSIATKVQAGWNAAAVNPLSGFNLFARALNSYANAYPAQLTEIANLSGVVDAIGVRLTLTVTGLRLWGSSGSAITYTARAGMYTYTATATINDGVNTVQIPATAGALASYPANADWSISAAYATEDLACPPVIMG
jgi:hypothetical protein